MPDGCCPDNRPQSNEASIKRPDFAKSKHYAGSASHAEPRQRRLTLISMQHQPRRLLRKSRSGLTKSSAQNAERSSTPRQKFAQSAVLGKSPSHSKPACCPSTIAGSTQVESGRCRIIEPGDSRRGTNVQREGRGRLVVVAMRRHRLCRNGGAGSHFASDLHLQCCFGRPSEIVTEGAVQ